jgi:hypothetical protein
VELLQADMSALEASAEPARTSFVSLPRALQHAILRRLPVDARARCAAVCRGWRAATSDASLWTRLDLSPASGVRVRVTEAVLRGASGLARGALTALDLSGCARGVTHDALLAAVIVNAGLTELRVCHGALKPELRCEEVEALLRAAPLLRVLDADVQCDAGQQGEQLISMLRHEAPFGPLRVHRLNALFDGLAPAEREAAVTAFAAATAAHDSLTSLRLSDLPLATPAQLDAVVDAVLSRRIRSLELSACELSPASAPSLARLLRGSALAELCIWNGGQPLLHAPDAALLANALRANSTLTTLQLPGVGLGADVAATTALLGALVGHASLRELHIQDVSMGAHAAMAGAALGALIAANAPALHKLEVYYSNLGDDGLAALVDALPANTHLRTLKIIGNNMSEAFSRNHVLPAVRGNTSLRSLRATTILEVAAGAAHEAEALVAARAVPQAA